MVLYLTVNQVDSCHSFLCDPLIWDTKDILWIDDRVLIMTYESLEIGYLKRHILDAKWSPQRWLCDQYEIIHPWYWLKEWDGIKSLAKVVEISEKEFPMISTHTSTNLSDRLGFDNWLYPKSFISLM